MYKRQHIVLQNFHFQEAFCATFLLLTSVITNSATIELACVIYMYTMSLESHDMSLLPKQNLSSLKEAFLD